MLAETIGALRVLNRSRLIPRAALSALCACQIGLVVARCWFWDCSRNPGTLGVSYRPRLRHGADSVKEVLRGDLDMEIFCKEVAQRSWQEMTRDLSQRSCQEISFREIEQRSYLQISYKDLAWRLQIETLCRDLARVEILYRDLAKRTGIAI